MNEIIEDLSILKSALVNQRLIDEDNHPCCLYIHHSVERQKSYFMCKNRFYHPPRDEDLYELEKEGYIHDIDSCYWWEACDYCDSYLYQLCMIFRKYDMESSKEVYGFLD